MTLWHIFGTSIVIHLTSRRPPILLHPSGYTFNDNTNSTILPLMPIMFFMSIRSYVHHLPGYYRFVRRQWTWVHPSRSSRRVVTHVRNRMGIVSTTRLLWLLNLMRWTKICSGRRRCHGDMGLTDVCHHPRKGDGGNLDWPNVSRWVVLLGTYEHSWTRSTRHRWPVNWSVCICVCVC